MLSINILVFILSISSNDSKKYFLKNQKCKNLSGKKSIKNLSLGESILSDIESTEYLKRKWEYRDDNLIHNYPIFNLESFFEEPPGFCSCYACFQIKKYVRKKIYEEYLKKREIQMQTANSTFGKLNYTSTQNKNTESINGFDHEFGDLMEEFIGVEGEITNPNMFLNN